MSDGVNPVEVLLTTDDLDGTISDGRGGRRTRGRLAGGVRDKLTMAEMKARMGSLYKDGVSYVEIANTVSDEFGLEGPERFKANGIHYHIKSLLDYWRNMGLLHVDERMAMTLARYDQLEMLCMEAYFASCAGKETSMYEKQVERARSKNREQILRDQIASEREQQKMHPNGINPMLKFELDDGDLAEMLVTTAEKVKEYRRTEDNLAGDPKWVRLLIDINDKRAALWGLKGRKDDTADQEGAKLSDEQRDERLVAVLSAAAHRRSNLSETNLAPIVPLDGFDEEPEQSADPEPQLAEQGPLPDPDPEPEQTAPEYTEALAEQIEESYEKLDPNPEPEDDGGFDFSDLEESGPTIDKEFWQ